MKIITTFFLLCAFLTLSGCSDKRTSPHETTKLFVKYMEEKNLTKLYDLMEPETKKRFSHDKEKLLRTNFQINRYKVKQIRYRSRSKDDSIHHMEIVLENGDSGFIALKKIDGRFYVMFE